ncbi:MAG: ABC transporter permease subunit [Planctomycetes bacterium]|nr:ABC transporter permease subunit [Planctomycetota bacterium]MBI3844249.1 ABC transporter permease subunit [Planctomycetota bacterium]
MNPTIAIAQTTFREAVRHRLVLLPSAVLAILVLLSGQIAFFGFGREAEMVREVTASTLSVGASAIAVLVAIGALSGEMHDGAALLLFVKPLTTSEVIAGKLLGSLAAAVPAAVAMTAAGAASLAWRGDPVPVIGLASVTLLALAQAAILASVGLALSIGLHRSAAGLGAALVFALGHLRPFVDSACGESPMGRVVRFVLFAPIPNLVALDPTVPFGRGQTPPSLVLVIGVVYAALFASLAVALGAMLLRRAEVARA